jgi:hypothetical protein
MVGTVGAMVSFQEGSELLTELAGVAVDAKQVERTAEALGKQIAADERQCTQPSDALPHFWSFSNFGCAAQFQRTAGNCTTGNSVDCHRDVKLFAYSSLEQQGDDLRLQSLGCSPMAAKRLLVVGRSFVCGAWDIEVSGAH